jgi:hypothetical protein
MGGVGQAMEGERVRVSIEPPEGWGPTRLLLVRLRKLGYQAEEYRVFDAVGRSVLVITGQAISEAVAPPA